MRKFSALLALGFLAACSGDKDPVSPQQSLVGTYTLRTVNGQNTPATFTQSGDSYQISSGTVSLNADGSCSHRVEERFTSGSQSFTDNTVWLCTYTVNGNTVTATDVADGEVYTVMYSNASLTWVSNGMSLVYRR